MLVKVAQSFPLSTSEVMQLHDKIMAADVSGDLGSDVTPYAECRLLTDNWLVYAYPNITIKPRDRVIGHTNGSLGIGDIWVKPGLTRSKTVRVIAHEMSHLLTAAIHNLDNDNFLLPIPGGSHGPLFETVFRRVCDAAGIEQPPKSADMSKYQTCYG